METKTNRRAKFTIALATLLAGAFISDAALAGHRHRHHGARIGVYIGAPIAAYPFYRPYYRPYYYSPYYYPPVVVAPAAPPVYVEQPQYQPQVIQPPVPLNQQPQSYQAPAPQPQAEMAPQGSDANMWYYCAESRSYYPYVQQCAAGWQQVTPQPRS
jgi:hypothetical protein